MTFKGHKRTFWGDKNVLCFCCDYYMGVYISQNSLTVKAHDWKRLVDDVSERLDRKK